MKEVRLKKIQLSNFKSLNIEVEFNKGATRISGKNGIGKTSVASAFYWLLTSYTSPSVPKNFALFDDRVELTHETPLAKVKVWIEIDGFDYTIEKTAEAKFTRPRGSSEWVKASSDTYTIYIDEIETSATAFNEWINANLCPVEFLPYAMSGEFFAYLVNDDKNKARKVLVDIAGEVKEEDFKGDYEVIAEAMKRYTTAEIVEQSKKKKKPLEERQLVIPNEIDRKEERLSELKAMDFSFTESEIERVKKEIETIDGLLLGNADAIKPILEHNKEIERELAEKRLSLMNSRLDHKEKQSALTSEIKAKIADTKRGNEEIEKDNAKRLADFEKAKKDVETISNEINALNALLESLRTKKDKVKARVFTDDHCPYCGAELDPMEIEKKKEEFNNAKKIELDAIVAEGKATKAKIEKKESELAFAQNFVDRGCPKNPPIDITPLEEELAKIEATFVPFEDTDEYACLMLEIDALAKEMKEIPSNDNELLTSQKKGLIDELSELSKKLGLKDEIGKVEKEIEDLKMELREVANSIAILEQTIFKCKEYDQEKNELVSLRINGKMKKARFEMWGTLKSGELVPDLILTNERGVKFNSTNFANRIELMLDLQELFCKTFDINLPRFIDESAVFSPSNLPTFDDAQAIYLFASDEPTLCVN